MKRTWCVILCITMVLGAIGVMGPNVQAASNNNGDDLEMLHPILIENERYLTKPGEWEHTASAKWVGVELPEEEAAKWPRLAKALRKYTSEADNNGVNDYYDMKNTVIDGYQQLLEQAAEDEEELDWPFYLNQETVWTNSVLRADSVAFSMLTDYYCYLGGAHPYYAYYGKSFDTETGHELMVEDVFADTQKLNEVLYDRLLTDYEDLDLDKGTVKRHLDGCLSGENEYEWVLDVDGASFFFNPYVLTSFAGGMQEITLPFDTYSDLYVEKYAKAPQSYVKALGTGGGVQIDIDGDGEIEDVDAWVYTDHDDSSTAPEMEATYLTISIDGESDIFVDYESYGAECYFVHTPNGNYIYYFVSTYGSTKIAVYDLSNGNVRRLHRYQYGELLYHGSYYDSWWLEECDMGEGTDKVYKDAFTDPDKVQLLGYVDALSTTSGKKTYYISQDGTLKTEDTVYDVTSSWITYIDEKYDYTPGFVFTTRLQLTMDLLDENGRVVKKNVKIPQGTKLKYLRTDNKTFADFGLEDGSVVRAPIDVSEWPQHICNEELEDALDGVLFAG